MTKNKKVHRSLCGIVFTILYETHQSELALVSASYKEPRNKHKQGTYL